LPASGVLFPIQLRRIRAGNSAPSRTPVIVKGALGEATVKVLRGRIRLTAGEVAWEGRRGDLLVVPDARHALHALEDSAVLLTVSKAAQARHP
jgi:hypothetical protein